MEVRPGAPVCLGDKASAVLSQRSLEHAVMGVG
jgi:hypothetical protein